MSLVPRPRLTRAIQQSLERGLALVVAPAGFGKTEAILDAVGDLAVPLEIPVPAGVEGLARALINFASPRDARGLIDLLQRPPTPERDAHLVTWVTAKLRDTDRVIVIDDFQRINAVPAAREFIGRVIEATIPRTRWAIASREMPELPIGTWLALDRMRLPLLSTELGFQYDEAQRLATALGATIDPADLATIVDDAEGWPLIVRLALGAWNTTRAVVPLRIRTNAVLFRFIGEQVWDHTTEPERELLLATALLRRAAPAVLAAAGFDRPAEALERLGRRIALVQETTSGEYRLHETFREYVIERYRASAEAERLAGVLATAYGSGGFPGKAIALSLEAEQWTLTLALLREHGLELVADGERELLEAAIAALPRRIRTDGVVVAIRGIQFANGGLWPAAESDLSAVRHDKNLPPRVRRHVLLRLAQLRVNRGDPGGAIEILDEIGSADTTDDALDAVSLRAAAHANAGQFALAQRAIDETLAAVDGAPSEVRARILMRLAFASLYLGDYPAAEYRALVVAEIADANGLSSLACRAYGVLFSVSGMLYTNSSLSARYAEQALAAARLAGDKGQLALALLTQLTISVERADDERFESSLAEFQLLNVPMPARQSVPLRWSRALYNGGHGRLREAVRILGGIDRHDLDSATKALVDALLGCLLAAGEGRPERERATALLEAPILSLAVQDIDARQKAAFAHAYRSLGLWLLGRSKLAQRSLGPPLRNLPERDVLILGVIRSVCSTPHATMTAQKLDQLLAPLAALELGGHQRFLKSICRPAPAVSAAGLTRAELEILRELRVGGTSDEIAHRVGRSPKTINNHLDSIYSKLGRRGRAAALAYAVEQGWLDATT